MKIVFIGYSPRYGGAGKSMIGVANALANMGHSITLIFIKEEKLVYDINKSIDILFIPETNKRKNSNYFITYKKIKKILKEKSPNITITFWVVPAIMITMMRKSITGKVIYSERGDPGDKEYRGVLGITRNIMFKRLDGFVFQIKGAQDYFNKRIKSRSIIINNPVYINYEDFDIPAIREKKVVNVGRLHSQKNHGVLIDAFSKLNCRFSDYILEIWGEGNLKQSLQSKIDNLNLSNRVFLRGTTKDILSKIVNASLFVLSSDYEGMPNALMEAMALGVPCISTDCKPGGARELIKNNVNGVITPINNADKLALAMEELLENKEKAYELGLQAKNICITHKKEIIFKKWETYLYNLVRQ